jgi:hypothetical protein
MAILPTIARVFHSHIYKNDEYKIRNDACFDVWHVAQLYGIAGSSKKPSSTKFGTL